MQPRYGVPEGQRRCEHAEPTHVVSRPVDALQRHPHDLGGSSVAAKTKQVFDKRSFSKCGIPEKNAALLISQNLPGQLRLTIKRSRICRYKSPSRPQQFNHLPLLVAVCTVHSRSAGVDVDVRVGPTIKKQIRNLTQSHGGGVPQGIALRVCHPVSFTSRDTLVRIKLAFVEQKLEHLCATIPHCDRQ